MSLDAEPRRLGARPWILGARIVGRTPRPCVRLADLAVDPQNVGVQLTSGLPGTRPFEEPAPRRRARRSLRETWGSRSLDRPDPSGRDTESQATYRPRWIHDPKSSQKQARSWFRRRDSNFPSRVWQTSRNRVKRLKTSRSERIPSAPDCPVPPPKCQATGHMEATVCA